MLSPDIESYSPSRTAVMSERRHLANPDDAYRRLTCAREFDRAIGSWVASARPAHQLHPVNERLIK
jgi:hypothetical protein